MEKSAAESQWAVDEKQWSETVSRLGEGVEKAGLGFLHLWTGDLHASLFGYTVHHFTRDNGELLPTAIAVGDTVGLGYVSMNRLSFTGEVQRIQTGAIWIAVKRDIGCAMYYDIVLVRRAAVHKRLAAVPEDCSVASNSEIYGIWKGRRAPKVLPPPYPAAGDIHLAVEQIQATQFAVNACSDLCLITGPPGCGKTTVIAEIARQLVQRMEKVLILAPSVSATDTVMEKLEGVVEFVRVGQPAKRQKNSEHHLLEALVRDTSCNAALSDINTLIEGSHSTLYFQSIENCDPPHRPVFQGYIKQAKALSLKAATEVIEHYPVVLSTLTCSDLVRILSRAEGSPVFDTVLVDDCNQAAEESIWLPVMRARKAVLVGDLQGPSAADLNPAVASQSPFTRLYERYPQTVFELTAQHRMSASLWKCVSEFYSPQGTLTDADSANSLVFVDTIGSEMRESGDRSSSKWNIGEASLVSVLANEMTKAGIAGITVLSPFPSQLLYIASQTPAVAVATIESMIGKETEGVILSLVRSNSRRNVAVELSDGLLKVALTRAKRMLCIVGDSETMSRSTALSNLSDFLYAHSDLRSVQANYSSDSRVLVNQGDFQ